MTLTDISVDDHHGRESWQATAQPTTAYDPRCSCCSVLEGHFNDGADQWVIGPSARIRLDSETGFYGGRPASDGFRITRSGMADETIDGIPVADDEIEAWAVYAAALDGHDPARKFRLGSTRTVDSGNWPFCALTAVTSY